MQVQLRTPPSVEQLLLALRLECINKSTFAVLPSYRSLARLLARPDFDLVRLLSFYYAYDRLLVGSWRR